MSQTNLLPSDFTYVKHGVDATIPPMDGSWLLVEVLGTHKLQLAVYDKNFCRWFTGKGHALDGKKIYRWKRATP